LPRWPALAQELPCKEGIPTTQTQATEIIWNFVNNTHSSDFSFLLPLAGTFVMHFSPKDLEIIQEHPIKGGLRAFYDFLEGQRSQLDEPAHSNWISGLLQAPSEGKLRWWSARSNAHIYRA
jgi:hypothetical protein